MDSSMPVYTIGSVSRILEVPPSTIRSWEERYGVVLPDRTSGGHRVYTHDQLEQLRFISRQIAEGMQPGDAHRLLKSHLNDPDGPVRRAAPPRGGRGVLLAERDPGAAALTAHYLQEDGLETTVASSVGEAERIVRQTRPRLAIIDLFISGGDALELCRRLADDALTKVVAISPIDSREDALGAGADEFLQKPLDPQALLTTVREVLDGARRLPSSHE